MQYEAMEWDHVVGNSTISWVVMECAGVGMRAGAVQALTPRRDVAYFVDRETAEAAAKEFARLKNLELGRDGGTSAWKPIAKDEFVAYPWDHLEGQYHIRWGLLRWQKDDHARRTDVAYLLDRNTAEHDALMLEKALMREQA
jgi:hypothetical protein